VIAEYKQDNGQAQS